MSWKTVRHMAYGVLGILTSSTTSLLHNVSTILISTASTEDLIGDC